MGRDIAEVEVYDIRRDQWRDCPCMHTARSALAAATVGMWVASCAWSRPSSRAAAGGQVYAIGGQSGKRCVASCEWLDPLSGAGWLTATAQLHTSRKYASAAVMSGRIHVVGGLTMQRTRLSDMEAYDPREGLWHRLPGMQQPRSSFGLASLGGRLYASA